MIRFCRFLTPLRAIACALVAFVAGASAVEDAPTAFLEAYREFQSGERLERNGDIDAALAKYRACVERCEEIQRTSPEYQPVVITFRLGKARAKVASLESADRPPTARVSGNDDFGLEGPLPVFDSEPAKFSTLPLPRAEPPRPLLPPPSAPPARVPFSSYRIPQPGVAPTALVPRRPAVPVAPRVEAPMTFSDPSAPIGRGAARAMEEEIGSLRFALKQEELRSEELARKLLEGQAQEQMALHELDRTKVSLVELKSQLAMSRQARGDLEATNERLTSEKGADAERISTLQADLVAARADLEVAEDYNSELFAKLESAASYIDASEAIREQLTTDRSTLETRLEEGLSDETDRIAAENESLREERDTAVAGAERAEELSADNVALAAKLTDAEQQIEKLAALDPEKEKIIADLRGELASVSRTLSDLREERIEGQEKIAELETQLEATATAAASATGAIAEENELLKKIVSRQIRDQAKRQQARKLVEEEMEKLEVRSTAVIDQLAALGNAETVLSDQERRLVSGPEDAARSQAGSVNGEGFTMTVEKDVPDAAPPENDLPEELVGQAGEAFARLNRGDYQGAAEIYRKIADEAPESYFAAVSLGVAELGLQNSDEAVAAFERALELRSNDSYAQTKLNEARSESDEPDAAPRTFGKPALANP